MGAVLLKEQHLRVILCQIAAGIGRQRRPPNLSLEAGVVDGFGETAHSCGPDAVICLPVPFAPLIAIVNVYPGESQLNHLGKRADNLIDRKLAFISPCAPNGLVSTFRRNGRSEPEGLFHIRGIITQRLEEVSGALHHELPERTEGISRLEDNGSFKVLADAGPCHIALAFYGH